MRILITGSVGFTGAYLKKKLISLNHTVIDLQSDLTNNDALAIEIKQINPDAVVHLAAISFVAHGDVSDFYTVNLLGTYNLLHCLYLHAPNVKSILLASSANIYGNNTLGIITEEVMPQPTNDYGVSKWAMEKMASLWVSRLPLFIVRPFNYTGVGQHEQFLIPKIVKHFSQKLNVIELGNIDITREFNDVRMVTEIYASLLSTPPIGEIVNICSGVGYSIQEILTLCAEISTHHLEVKILPNLIREGEVKSLIGNPEKLKNIIGDFKMIGLAETLRWMLNTPTIK